MYIYSTGRSDKSGEIALGFASCDLTAAIPTTREIYPRISRLPVLKHINTMATHGELYHFFHVGR